MHLLLAQDLRNLNMSLGRAASCGVLRTVSVCESNRYRHRYREREREELRARQGVSWQARPEDQLQLPQPPRLVCSWLLPSEQQNIPSEEWRRDREDLAAAFAMSIFSFIRC